MSFLAFFSFLLSYSARRNGRTATMHVYRMLRIQNTCTVREAARRHVGRYQAGEREDAGSGAGSQSEGASIEGMSEGETASDGETVLVSCRCPQAPGIYTCVDDPDRGIYT